MESNKANRACPAQTDSVDMHNLPEGDQTLPRGLRAVVFYTWSRLTRPHQRVPLPRHIGRDHQLRFVFLSARQEGRPTVVQQGVGCGLAQALNNAINQMGATPKLRHLKLDFVQKVSHHRREEKSPGPSLHTGLLGFALPQRFQTVWLPEQLKVLAEKHGKRRLKAKFFLSRIPQPKRPRIFSTFQTLSFYSNGRQRYRLYRGHRMFHRITPALLTQTLRWAGDYLTRAVRPNGKFVYQYNPVLHQRAKRYNILRHAGTTFSMFQLYHVTQNKRLKQAAQRALQFLFRFLKPSPLNPRKALSLVEGIKSKLGGAGLALVAITESLRVTKHSKGLPEAKKLAFDIALRQKSDGSFAHIYYYPSGRPHPFVSSYYPGEAILGLMRLYSWDRNKLWLDTATQAADYLILVRDKGKTIHNLNHDHWLLYGLSKLYRHAKKKIYLEHAHKIVAAIQRSQNRTLHPPDWSGGYYAPPRSTPTATRSEGLCAAYSLLQSKLTPYQKSRLIHTLKRGVQFQLQTQMRPENTMYLPHPNLAFGGFQKSLTQSSIRIDYVQHNISSILCLRKILLNL